MNLGKTLFAKVMDVLPWKTFQCIVQPHYAGRLCERGRVSDSFA